MSHECLPGQAVQGVAQAPNFSSFTDCRGDAACGTRVQPDHSCPRDPARLPGRHHLPLPHPDLWYEDVRWEHRAPAWRTMLAASLDTLPNWQAPGAGMLLALGLRCLTASGQTLGERLAGLSLVSEGLVHQGDGEDEDD